MELELQYLDKYEILEEMGRGNMGTLYKARDGETAEFVAIKILSEEQLGNRRAVDRFKREIRSSIQLDHPNIVRALSAGEYGGRLYYVMEFVDGTTVKKELVTKGRFPVDRAIDIVMQVAQSLAYATEFDIVHRDIKPENILITQSGAAKLADMGLAKSTQSQNKLTMMGTVLGTPNYMSPEQAKGEEQLDARTDIYSLGATFYHMVSGIPPYEGKDPVTIITNLLSKDPPPIHEFNPDVREDVCYVIDKMMARDRDRRYATPAQLFADLELLKRGETTEAERHGATRIQSRTAAKEFAYRFSYVPNDPDFMFGRIAINSKAVTGDQMQIALDYQESLARVGALVSLPDCLVTLGYINPGQRARIHETMARHEIDVAQELFLKNVTKKGLVDAKQMAECRKMCRVERKSLLQVMLEKGFIDEKQHRIILGNIKKIRRQEEDRLFIKVALENQFITDKQAEKAMVIQANRMVMGNFKDLAQIMHQKRFVEDSHKAVLLRAIRRNALTGVSVADLIMGQKVSDGESPFAISPAVEEKRPPTPAKPELADDDDRKMGLEVIEL